MNRERDSKAKELLPFLPPWVDRIGSIEVAGFKSIGVKRALELAPLTLLGGANSSGKSSMLQPLLLLKQTLEVPYDPGALLLDGPNVRFTAVTQVLTRQRKPVSSGQFSVGLHGENSASLELLFSGSEGKGFDIDRQIFSMPGYESIRLNKGVSPVKLGFPQFPTAPGSGSSGAQILSGEVTRDRCFLNLTFTAVKDRWQPPISPALPFSYPITFLIHVPGLRGNPTRAYRTTAVSEKYPGLFQDYVASIVSHWQSVKSEKLEVLGQQLSKLELTWRVQAHAVSDTQVELRVGRLPGGRRGGARDLVSIADVGFGISQVLPVVVALLTADARHIVYIEQPEIHLHPKAQRAMAALLADAAKRGVTVVAETHSNLLFLAVQTLIAKGELDPKIVRFHWFSREPTTGLTQVSSIQPDADGAFGDWPADFDDVTLGAERDYLDAVATRSTS